MEEILKKVQKRKTRPRLLLHACCGPCSSHTLEILATYFDIHVLFYNPNIYPHSELHRRKEEARRLMTRLPLPSRVTWEECTNDEDAFYQAVRELSQLGEGSVRCHACYELRLRFTAQRAKEKGFDYFTTTLSISPHKDSIVLNEIGAKLEAETGVCYLYSDFKKKDGYRRSLQISKEYDLYRQEYCGCIYSMREKEVRDTKVRQEPTE